MGKATKVICYIIGAFIAFWGLAFFAYFFTMQVPFYVSGIGLIVAMMLTAGGIVIMYA